MKLKKIKGLLKKKKAIFVGDYRDRLYFIQHGYNKAIKETGDKEIKIDKKRAKDIIKTGIKLLILNELSPYTVEEAVEEIVQALAKADIIKMKRKKGENNMTEGKTKTDIKRKKVTKSPINPPSGPKKIISFSDLQPLINLRDNLAKRLDELNKYLGYRKRTKKKPMLVRG